MFLYITLRRKRKIQDYLVFARSSIKAKKCSLKCNFEGLSCKLILSIKNQKVSLAFDIV